MTDSPAWFDSIARWRDLPPAQAADAARADQNQRWAAGEGIPAEVYLQILPKVAEDPEQALVLIYGEVLSRLARGETANLTEYQARFPQYAERLALQFDVHQALAASDAGQRTSELDDAATIDLSPTDASGTVSARQRQSAPPGYSIVAELGRGGMGVVYSAVQNSIRRLVALKMVLSGEYASDKELARFHKEAEAVAGLTHPNIVQLYEFGTHHGLPYFTLEYMPGGSLAKRVKDSALPAGDAVAIVEKLADGTAAAHARGIIHRDLKPENVLLAADGAPKIADFGLAKQFEQGDPSAPGANDDPLTRTGVVVGTPSYMAPEQARGDNRTIGPAADIWALGAVFYRLLTGRPPFLGANPIETIRLVLEIEPLPPRSLLPNLPRDLETICLKCLRKDPQKRYARATDLADDLRRWKNGQPIQARPVGRIERGVKWIQRNPLVSGMLTAIVLLFVGGASGIYLKYREAKENEARANRSAEERGVALAEKDRALKEKDVALDEKDRAHEEQTYAQAIDKVVLAQAAFDKRDPAVAQAQLEQVPPHLRHWEYSYLKRRFAGGIYTLAGHTGPVNAVAMSPNGRLLATASNDQTVKVWDVRSGILMREFAGFPRPVHCLAFSPDGARIAAGCSDGTARVFSTHTGASLFQLKGHLGPSSIFGIAFSPDGRLIGTAGSDARAIIWDASNGKLMRRLQHGFIVDGVAFSPNSAWILTASADRTARVWHAITGIPIAEFKGIPASVTCAEFSPDGKQVVAGYDVGAMVKVWDVQTAKVVLDLRGHAGSITSAAFSPDGTRIVTASADRTARIWDAKSGAPLLELVGHADRVSSAVFSPDGMRVATGSFDQTARIWDANTGVPQIVLRGSVRQAVFDSTADRIITVGGDPAVWDVRTGNRLAELKGHTAAVNCVAISPDGKRIVTGGERNFARDMRAMVWDADSRRMLFELKAHTHHVISADFSPDGERIITGSHDFTAVVWNARTGSKLLDLKCKASVLSARFSPNGKRIVTADSDAIVWDSITGESLLTLAVKKSFARSARYSPDGFRIVTANSDKTARVWDAQTGKLLLTLTGHTQPVESAAFSPDGSRIVTAARDSTARVWDARTGTPICVLEGHSRPLYSAEFSANGRCIATTSFDRTTRIWDAASGDAVDGVLTPEAADYRRFWTRPRPDLHNDALAIARKANDAFSANFHLECLLAFLPQDRPRLLAERASLPGNDAMSRIRAALHSPGLVDMPSDAMKAISSRNEPLALRLSAMLQLREGKTTEAIKALQQLVRVRALDLPPVEELLLAGACNHANRRDEAIHWFAKACAWLDRYQAPALAILGSAAAGIDDQLRLGVDPRYIPLDWESWHECRFLRAELESMLGNATPAR